VQLRQREGDFCLQSEERKYPQLRLSQKRKMVGDERRANQKYATQMKSKKLPRSMPVGRELWFSFRPGIGKRTYEAA
jgi:hypothetical protein